MSASTRTVLLGTLASVWLVGRAQARLGEHALALGRVLAGIEHVTGRDTAIELNGQRLHATSLSIEAGADVVLARFEAACAGELPRTAAAWLDRQPAERAPGVLVLRHRAPDGTAAALCLAGTRKRSARELLQGLRQFAQSGDAGPLGMRYLFVRERAGAASHVLLAWSEDRLALRELFPVHGDAAGSDIAQLPRPRAAERVLSARVLGAGYAVAAYRVAGEPGPALEGYSGELRHAGFRVVNIAAELGPERGLLAAVRGGERLLVQSFRSGEQGVIALTRIAAPAPGEESSHGD